ncbi:FAD binding domain-containing protein [Actinokineospora bangkokensis]|uniref:FAD-binding molybdopterin dehydrogenase n=1 Tax=Actinokineospora bangkokensis TaxID=1193682 RepID=A0A1Q9LL50_9PSEU|nr:FAD binding domain-containing protein [Actinokineospora bangkokensis]OLR92725.1 FAD-binding molybdopterin dehydrogenase [Actinokineospora bangkokensis]
MDQNSVLAVVDPGAPWRPGDAWLAGGTQLFSEPHPHVRRFRDLTRAGWEPLTWDGDALEVAATCTVAELSRFAGQRGGAVGQLVEQCCRAFLASFKVWNAATVGGNLCNALPAGPMISLFSALDGSCLLLRDGQRRRVPAVGFARGPGESVLADGELLRSITVPAAAWDRRYAFRQVSLHAQGRSAALLIGSSDGGFALTITASTPRPVRLAFPGTPTAAELARAVEEGVTEWYDDVHGLPAWRRHMTLRLAEEIRGELA